MLDVGCGTGDLLVQLRPDLQMIGIDLSPAMLASGAARWPYRRKQGGASSLRRQHIRRGCLHQLVGTRARPRSSVARTGAGPASRGARRADNAGGRMVIPTRSGGATWSQTSGGTAPFHDVCRVAPIGGSRVSAAHCLQTHLELAHRRQAFGHARNNLWNGGPGRSAPCTCWWQTGFQNR